MRNLNDPFMSEQEKQHRLQLAIDPDLNKRHEQEAEKGNFVSFPSYWVVENQDLLKFAIAAEKTGTIFQLETEELKKIAPVSDVILYESDRREAGEWDYFYQKFAPYSYQLVYVVLINGKFGGWNGDCFAHAAFDPEECPYLDDFPTSRKLTDEGVGGMCLGLLEIPLEELTPYEDNRIHERRWDVSKQFQQSINLVIKDLLKHQSKTHPRLKKSKRSNKGFGK